MSHSSTFGKTTFIYNGDYSGDITIRKHHDDSITTTVEIPAKDLEQFFLEWYASVERKKPKSIKHLP